MLLELKIWKEGRNILIRNDKFHINTYGETLEKALQNFHEAFLLTVEDNKELREEKTPVNLTLVMPYPIEKHAHNIEAVE